MLNENMGVMKSLVDSAKHLSSDLSSKSKLFNTILFSCAFLSLVGCIAIVSISTNKNSYEVAGTGSGSGNENNLLKLSSNGNTNFAGDLTILGDRNNLRATLEEERREKKEKEEDRRHPVVYISQQGRVRGTVLKSRENRDYFAFYQVPYAQNPVGKLRFALPEEPRRWWGTRDASKPGPECLQREKYATEPNITGGSEDCLHLNIYTPKLPASRRSRDELKLPVMFYIHGGGQFGNGTRYGAKYLMDEDVVYVNVEFRLGMFGCFTAGTKEFPGNLGDRDQVMALQWVQKNIHRFGGDPKKVLIFGNSSGGGHIHAHLFSPMSKGLFHRAIMQSGTCINKALIRPKPLEIVRDFILEVGCGDLNNTFDDTLECLRNVDGRTIALSAGQDAIFGFVPELHDDLDENKFLPELPFNLIDSGLILNQVPLIAGVVSREMYHVNNALSELLAKNATQLLNDQFEELLPGVVNIPDDKQHSVARKFRQIYFGDKEISFDTRTQLWDMVSDSTVHTVRIAGMAHANITSQPVYNYIVSKEPGYSYGEAMKDLYPPPYGVAHADELQYLFLYDGYPEYPVGSPWFEYSKKLVKIWTSFAKDGKPEIRNLPGNSKNVEWKPISLDDNGMEWLELGDAIKFVRPFTARMQLWDEYIEELYIFNS